MACIKITPLNDPRSHLLMKSLGFVNRVGDSSNSIWSDPVSNDAEFYLDPNTIIHSAKAAVNLAYRVGLKQGEKNARHNLNRKLKSLCNELIDKVLL